MKREGNKVFTRQETKHPLVCNNDGSKPNQEEGCRFRHSLLLILNDTHYFSTIIIRTSKEENELIEIDEYLDPITDQEFFSWETNKILIKHLEIESLKGRLKSLEKRKKSRTSGFKRLRKVDQCVGRAEEDIAEKELVLLMPVTTAGEVVTTANVEVTTVNAPTTTIDELTLAQTLIEIKAAKPKAVTSCALQTTTTTRPKARGVAKDKGKGIMVEPEVPLKKKDQVALDEENGHKNLKAQLQAET
ncbi:hypothetical protein Tco_0282049 [Tanacetum coccineum]